MRLRPSARLGGMGVALAVLVGTAPLAAASRTATCVVSQFLIGATPEGTALAMASGAAECFGALVFFGVSPQQVGAGSSSLDDVSALRGLLLRWTPSDGVPGVAEWVSMTPGLAARLRRGGLDPVRLLQWVNAQDVGAPWPAWLPQPSAAAGRRTTAASVMPWDAVVGGPGRRCLVGRCTDAAHSVVLPPRAAAGRALPVPRPIPPPLVVPSNGSAVPCVVAPACRRAVQGYDRYLALPAVGRFIWWFRLHAAAASAASALLTASAIWLRWMGIRRRNRAWYGTPATPWRRR